ncbi:uncharacterized protein LOC127749979 [Frankliniella occidentalis]|uniref:Uncharacterized protein LOC127749979 n=1 Tax=Frankliniella occidentalis TaxID=133901 RepID=A0A9C6UE64_FRAOC|nr:uncharacterized protein LOC127749979 [Frankliniella occidentalis]
MDTPYLQDAEENTPNKKVSHILQIESTTRGIGDCVMELQSSDSQNIEINTEHPNPAGGTVPTRSCDLPTPVWGSVESLVTQASSRPYIAPRGLSRLSYFGPRTPLLRALPMEQSLESDTADCTVIADIPRPSEVGWCTRCERQFRSWKDYVQHCSNYHTHPYSEVCKFCAFPIRDKDVGAHERNHQRSSVSCSLCSARFTKIHSLKNHEACYHNNLPRGNGASSVPTLSSLTPHNPMLPSNSISKVSVPAPTMESADPSLADGLRRSARIASLKKLVPPTDTV